MTKLLHLAIFLALSSHHLVGQSQDTIPPVITCKSLYMPGGPNCYSIVDVTKFVDTVFDNSGGNIDLGMRFVCGGTGFPENSQSFLLLSPYWGTLEIWARDQSENTTSCTTTVQIADFNGNCDPIFDFVTYMADFTPLNHTNIDVTIGNCEGDTFHLSYETYFFGSYSQFGYLANSGDAVTVTPSRNQNPLNGITTNDLILIQKHILGITPLDSPYKLIAADANIDGKITTTDIVILRKLMLGIYTQLPHGKSWRFIPKSYVFPNVWNPFLPPFPESIVSPAHLTIPMSYYEFIGVKIGDVNFSADPNH